MRKLSSFVFLDGDIGSECNMNNDCIDANAECTGTPSFCTCSTGYRNVEKDCIKGN
jgi:hypothetical protein